MRTSLLLALVVALLAPASIIQVSGLPRALKRLSSRERTIERAEVDATLQALFNSGEHKLIGDGAMANFVQDNSEFFSGLNVYPLKWGAVPDVTFGSLVSQAGDLWANFDGTQIGDGNNPSRLVCMPLSGASDPETAEAINRFERVFALFDSEMTQNKAKKFCVWEIDCD